MKGDEREVARKRAIYESEERDSEGKRKNIVEGDWRKRGGIRL